MPRAIEFVKWAHSKGLSSRSTGECGQDDKGKCGPGKTCAKGDGSGGQSALPAGRAHASKCGRKYAPGKEEVVEQDRKLSDDQWNRLPVQSIPHRTVLQANEETLKTKPINDLHVRNAAAIAKRIGVPDTHAEDRIKVLNSTDSLAQLVADAKATAPAFMKMAREPRSLPVATAKHSSASTTNMSRRRHRAWRRRSARRPVGRSRSSRRPGSTLRR